MSVFVLRGSFSFCYSIQSSSFVAVDTIIPPKHGDKEGGKIVMWIQGWVVCGRDKMLILTFLPNLAIWIWGNAGEKNG